MSSIFKHKEIIERARDLGRTNLLFIFGIIKAASIGVAITVFLQLFFDFGPVWDWQKIWQMLPKFMLWAVSYLCLLVTFDGAMFATVFLIHIPKKSESFFTFLLVGLETLQFAILSPALIEKTGQAAILGVKVTHWWYLIFSFYCMTIFFLIQNGKKEIEGCLKDFEPRVQPIIRKYVHSFRRGHRMVISAFIFAVSTFLFLLLTNLSEYDYTVEIVSASVLIFLAFWSFFLQHNQRQLTEKLFRHLPN